MEENVTTVQLLKEVPQVLSMIYQDCAQPSVKKVGRALETVFDLSNTILLPIKLINNKANILFKRHMDRYKEKLQNIEEEKIIDVSTIIGTPIIDRLTYITNDELADLFINILNKASSSDTVNNAHPAFIHIIDCLTVDETKLIKYLADKHYILYFNILLDNIKDGGFQKLAWNLTGLEHQVNLLAKDNIDTYLDNLARLKIIESQGNLQKSDENQYSQLQSLYSEVINELNEVAKAKEGYQDSCRFSLGFYEITEFGKAFIKACNP